jgi:uncharacterized membrane protein
MENRPAMTGRLAGRAESVAVPATVLGAGLGGFVDGILLHQLLQWHHMLSGVDPPDTVSSLQMNTVADGLFHAITWLLVLIGLGLLYARVTSSRGRLWSSRTLWGWILVGWGLFNLVEGIVDHHLLGVHHVRHGPGEVWWDLAFLALGVVLILGGWLLQRSGRPVDLCGERDSTAAPR